MHHLLKVSGTVVLTAAMALTAGCGGSDRESSSSGGRLTPPGGGTTPGGGTPTTPPVTAQAEALTTDLVAGEVQLYDLTNHSFKGSVSVEAPTAVAWDAGQQLYKVASFTKQEIYTIDPSGGGTGVPGLTGQVIDLTSGSNTQYFLLSLFDSILNFAVRPFDMEQSGQTTFVACLLNTKVVNGTSVQGVIDIDIPGIFNLGSTQVRGLGPYSLTTYGTKAYVCNLFSDSVTEIDASGQLLRSWTVGMASVSLPIAAAASDTGDVFVACALGGELAVISQSGAVNNYPLTTLVPASICYNPTNGLVYIGSLLDGSVTVWDPILNMEVNTHQLLSFNNALAGFGLSTSQIQTMLQNAFIGSSANAGGLSIANVANFLMTLVATFTGSSTGSSGGNFIGSLFTSLFGTLNSALANTPFPGLNELKVTKSGKVVATSVLMGGCSILDPATGNVSIVAPNGGLINNPNPTGAAGMFTGWPSCAIHNN